MKNIVHLDIPAFQATVEQVKDSSYRGRPLAVSTGSGSRALIVSASREAKFEGIQKGMFIKDALKREPHLILIDPNPELYQRAMLAIIKRLGYYSPLVEVVSYGHLAIDMTGTQSLYGRVKDSAFSIYKDIRNDFRLPSSLGVAVNKLVSHVAASYIQDYAELYDVIPGSEALFFSPLQLDMLPGLGATREAQLLDELNVSTIGLLSEIPLNKLGLVVGKSAYQLHQKATGVDESPVVPPSQTTDIKEEITFDEDSNDDILLNGALHFLVENACSRLRKRHQKANALRLFCRYADSKILSRRIQLDYPSHDEYVILHHSNKVFNDIFSRRVRVRYVSFTCENLVYSAIQESLFGYALDRREEQSQKIFHAMDCIRGRHGYKAIQFGHTANVSLAL